MSIKERLALILKREPKPQTEAKHFDYLEQIKADYGITKVGEKEFEVVVDGMKHVGSLSTIMNIAKGEHDGIWGNL